MYSPLSFDIKHLNEMFTCYHWAAGVLTSYLKILNCEDIVDKATFENYGSGDNLILSENNVLILVENSF